MLEEFKRDRMAQALLALVVILALVIACGATAFVAYNLGWQSGAKQAGQVARPQPASSSPNPPAPLPPPSEAGSPAFVQNWQPGQVCDAFKSAGLECENPRPMTKDDYGLGPMVALEGLRFFIPSLGEDHGGRIMSFATPEDLAKSKEYYDKFGRESAAFFSWTFARDNILVQINGDLPEEKARQYEAALAGLK